MLVALKCLEIFPFTLPSMVSSPKLSSPPESGKTKLIMGRSGEISTLQLASCHSFTSRSSEAKPPQA